MKKGVFVIIIALLAGVAAFYMMRSRKVTEHQGFLMDSMPELAWVRQDLNLTKYQFTQVADLHAVYRPKCMEMCRRISESHMKMKELADRDRKMTPELDAALREHAAIHAECQQAMLKHLYDTAAVLDEGQASRYLKTMIPYALDFTLSESTNLHAH